MLDQYGKQPARMTVLILFLWASAEVVWKDNTVHHLQDAVKSQKKKLKGSLLLKAKFFISCNSSMLAP